MQAYSLKRENGVTLPKNILMGLWLELRLLLFL